MTAARRVVLVTGLSGAGKSSILRTLEDLGFQAIDNLPLALVGPMVVRETTDLAIGVDARTRDFTADALLRLIADLKGDAALQVELIFAEASQDILLRRYTQTRRRHPLAVFGPVVDGINAEDALLHGLKAAADLLIDTTELPAPALRRLIETSFADPAADDHGLSVTIQSFAYPAGLPREADLVFDARFLRNPHYESTLRALTGLDPAVGAYISQDVDYAQFFSKLCEMTQFLLPRFVQEGKRYVTIGIGCTGGRHRSVFIAEQLAQALARAGWRVCRSHRELARDFAAPSPIYGSSPVPVARADRPPADTPGATSAREA
jgi:UPF0042 nucleotide-binding protein